MKRVDIDFGCVLGTLRRVREFTLGGPFNYSEKRDRGYWSASEIVNTQGLELRTRLVVSQGQGSRLPQDQLVELQDIQKIQAQNMKTVMLARSDQ